MYQSLIQPLIQISRDAGDAILEVYNSASDVEIVSKADNSPLTKADRAANAVIVAGLEALAQEFPIISEENKLVEYQDRKDYDHYWLVDPLDGTKEFIKKNGEFTVNIALVQGNRPVMGFVYAPVLDKMYYAIKNEGAFLIENGNTSELKAPAFTMKDKNLNVVCSRSHLNEGTQKFIDALVEPEKVSKGSSLKFLLIASGEAHLYPRLAPTMEWDTGAAQIVLEEAGGKVINNDTGNPLEYNKENLLNPFFIAYGNLVE